SVSLSLLIFFFTDPATSEIYTLSLHDALPIWELREGRLPPPGRLPGLRSQVDRQDAASPARRQGDRRHVHGHPRRTGPVRDAEALRDGDHRDGRGRPAHVSIDRRKSRGCYDRDEGPILLPETWPGRGGGRHPLRVQVPAR